MPRIDPSQLLRTLSVLLSPHGGIKSSAEVGRLVQLMQKFSKKLVSKVIYVKILLASHPDLLEHFLKEKGWELLNAWFDDAIKALNWPLCAEMTQLFTKCPMTAQRLKENVEINLAPKLIRQLSCDGRVDATVRENASQVLKKWMAVVATVSSSPEPPMQLTNFQPVVLLQSSLPQQPPPSSRTTRGSRSAQTTPAANDNTPRVPVIVHTDFEEILNLDRMPTATTAMKDASESEGQVWVGKGGSKRAERNARRRGALGQSSRKTPPPGRSKEIVDSEEEQEDSDEEYKPPQDDPFDTLLSSSISNEKQKVNKTMKLIGVIRNETLDEVEPEPVKLLQGLAMELSETLKKEAVEVKKEETDSKKAVEKAKEKEARRERERQERREKEKREERRKGEERGDRKDRDKHKHSSDKEREKQREERRRKEKEREKQKEKERKEKKRESKPYRETEMRDKLDSTEKLKIKELAQKLREDSKNKKEDFQPTPSSASLPKIPKVAKADEAKKEKIKGGAGGGGGKKAGPSFEDLMFSLNSSSAQPPIKPAPIKNKSRDLIASLYEDSPVSKAAAKQREEEKKRNEMKSKLSSSSLTNGDKSSSVAKENGASSPVPKTETETAGKPISEVITPEKKTAEKKEEKVEKEEEKKAIKRTSSDGAEPPKLKIKSQAQLKEGTMFGDFLSTIMPEQPKKKKIKLADLKAQKEAKAASENIVKADTEEKDDSLEKSLANASSSFSFYRDTMSEANGVKEANKEGSVSPPPQEDAPGSVPSEPELPFEEPESALPREVRGILVLTKGPKRSRRIQWKPQETLVEVEYFELDETERVNVNKLKFEEQRKNEAIAEKAKMLQKQNHVVEDNRAWPGMQTIECELPEIDYGGNSNEKKEQEQRENKVLQILFFNNKLPNDPSEPDAAGGARIVTKPIPLEDTSGDEAYTDYSAEPWPAPIQEKENIPVFDNLLNNIQMQPELLKNLMGSALPEAGNPDSVAAAAALYAAQKAAEETLRKHGVEVPRRQEEILPMEEEVPMMNPSVPPPIMAPPFEEEFPSDYPPEFPADGPPRDFYQQPPPPWQNGAPPFRGGPPHHRGGPYNRNGPPPNEDFNRGGFRGGPRGGGPMRDFHHNNHHNGYHHDRHHEDRGGWDRRDDRRREGGRKEYSRPCKFWMEKGYCREENRCKFPHPQGR